MDEKVYKIAKEFEKKIITRIILMKLNETREWPRDLYVTGNEFNSRFLVKSKPLELTKSIISTSNQSTVTSTKAVPVKKPKKEKKTLMGKWANKMKAVKSGDGSQVPENANNSDQTDSTKQADVSKLNESTLNVSTIEPIEKEQSIKEEVEVEDLASKYSINLVAKERFPASVSIKAIDNLSILNNLSVLNMKNVFVIKNNYKTYVFTLTESGESKEDKKPQKSTNMVSLAMGENDSKNNSNIVIMRMYGIAAPEKEFFNGIKNTIQYQIEQITIIERAKSIKKNNIPTLLDFKFVRENSTEIFFCYRMPKFMKRYIDFVNDYRFILSEFLDQIQMKSSQNTDFLMNKNKMRSGTTLKRSFKDQSITRSTFYVQQHNNYASMIAEPSGDLIDQDQINLKETAELQKSPIREVSEDNKSSQNDNNDILTSHMADSVMNETMSRED